MAMDPRSKNALMFFAIFISIIVIINIFARCDISPSEETLLKRELSFIIYDEIKAKALIPDSVSFSDFDVLKYEDKYIVTGSFKAKNAFGTMIPYKFTAEFTKDKKLISIKY